MTHQTTISPILSLFVAQAVVSQDSDTNFSYTFPDCPYGTVDLFSDVLWCTRRNKIRSLKDRVVLLC